MLDNQEQEGEMQEEDEEELERAEAFEHRYNFRFEVRPLAWTMWYCAGLCECCALKSCHRAPHGSDCRLAKGVWQETGAPM